MIDALTKGRRGTLRFIDAAAESADTADDVRAARAFVRRIDAEIAVVKKNIKDTETRAAELERLAEERADAVDRLNAARRQHAQVQSEQRQGILRSRITLAGLRGNEGAQIRFLDQLIADQRKVVARTKGVADKLLEQIELEELLKERRDILNQGREDAADKRGPSAFDLLKQSAENFSSFAGNVIGPSQPFADPSAFSADISGWLRRVNQTSAQSSAQGTAARNASATDRNTEATNRLTDAIIRAGRSIGTSGVSTGAVPPPPGGGLPGTRSGAVSAIERRWAEAGATRAYIDAHGGN